MYELWRESEFTVNSRLSIGATVGANYDRSTQWRRHMFPDAAGCWLGLKTLPTMHTEGVGWNGSVGVIASPTKSVKVGASWKSRTVIDSTGHASGNVSAQFAALGDKRAISVGI